MSTSKRAVTVATLFALSYWSTPAAASPAIPYEPLEVERRNTPPVVLDAAEAVLRRLGATELVRGPSEIRAKIATDSEMRQAIVVAINGSVIEVDYRTELRTRGGTWLRSLFRCASYTYSREHEIATSILDEAHALDMKRLSKNVAIYRPADAT
jgi:hypothetical protein